MQPKILITLAITLTILASSCKITNKRTTLPHTWIPQKSYAIIMQKDTYKKNEWQQVAQTLRQKYNADLILYQNNIQETKNTLKKIMPNYICFIVEPQQANRNQVVAIHRLTRQLDNDIYTDSAWGILTGYTPTDALNLAKTNKPLFIKRFLSGTKAANLDIFEQAILFDESKPRAGKIKQPNKKTTNKTFPADSAKSIADAFHTLKPQLFLTSGHGFPEGWQIGYNYTDGFLISKKGKLYAQDTKKKLYPINSPNPKIFMPVGNCLIGQIRSPDAFTLAMIHSCGVKQMFGYTVPTFFGYMGWGMCSYFFDMPHYSLSESFFANQQALLRELDNKYPKLTNKTFKQFDMPTINPIIRKYYPITHESLGLFWDRDAVAFYGDPAWRAEHYKTNTPWSYKLTKKHQLYTLTITTNQDGTWTNRPLIIFLPHRIKNAQINQGEELMPTITDNFIILPLTGKYKKNEIITLTFTAHSCKQYQTSAKHPITYTTTKNITKKTKLPKTTIANLTIPQKYQTQIQNALSLPNNPNQKQLIKAIKQAPKKQKEAILFLIANMPERDLRTISAKYLLKNTKYAYQALNKAKWKKQIPTEIFLNEILPYCTINERRDDWRQEFSTRFYPLVKNCKSPGKAAEILNKKMWKMINVIYSTKRPKPDQSPYESIQAKLASCTGLSILLIDACRSVGIPARMAGIPSWTHKRGNHSWVEIWDKGWHMLGAFDCSKLDDSWFLADTGKADPNNPIHTIYATSFKKTNNYFPCVWNIQLRYIPAVKVTQRYLKLANPQISTQQIRFLVPVYKQNNPIALNVTITHNQQIIASGISSDQTKDTNDILEFKLQKNKEYTITITDKKNKKYSKKIKTGKQPIQTLRFNLP